MKNRSDPEGPKTAGDNKPGKTPRRKRPDNRSPAERAAASSKASGTASKASRPDADRRKRPARGKPAGNRPGRGKPASFKTEPVPAEAPKPQPARLHKVMAAGGLGSRRAMEAEIRAGAVQLNGATASLGQSIRVGDRLQWGEKEWLVVGDQSQHRTLVYNKPEGEITSRNDPEGRPTVFDKLPFLKDARWVAIGRLDINTTGLLLLTTDGELAHAMMHPSKQVDREYVCRVRGLVSDEQVAQLKEGVMLDDGPAHFNDVKRMGGTGANQWYQVTLLEGRNREVRRLWEAMEHMVSRLKRVRYGAALLPKGLKVGHWHEVSARDHQVLREDVGLIEPSVELNLQLLSHREVAGKKQNTRSTRARDKRGAAADSSNPWSTAATNKRGGRAPGKSSDRSNAKRNSPDRSAGKGAAGRVAGKNRTAKPGSPTGGGRRPGSKPRRGDS